VGLGFESINPIRWKATNIGMRQTGVSTVAATVLLIVALAEMIKKHSKTE
jgi:hypothetical protein